MQLLAAWHRDNLPLYALATVAVILAFGAAAGSLAAGILTLAGARPGRSRLRSGTAADPEAARRFRTGGEGA